MSEDERAAVRHALTAVRRGTSGGVAFAAAGAAAVAAAALERGADCVGWEEGANALQCARKAAVRKAAEAI